jgi:hypothetical protein
VYPIGKEGVLDPLFVLVDPIIAGAGWMTHERTIIDATWVEVPKKRNKEED